MHMLHQNHSTRQKYCHYCFLVSSSVLSDTLIMPLLVTVSILLLFYLLDLIIFIVTSITFLVLRFWTNYGRHCLIRLFLLEYMVCSSSCNSLSNRFEMVCVLRNIDSCMKSMIFRWQSRSNFSHNRLFAFRYHATRSEILHTCHMLRDAAVGHHCVVMKIFH